MGSEGQFGGEGGCAGGVLSVSAVAEGKGWMDLCCRNLVYVVFNGCYVRVVFGNNGM